MVEILVKITTNSSSNVKADIRICPEVDFTNLLKHKRCFLGLHLDFSMHQMILYLGIFHLFIDVFGPDRSSWGYATIDNSKTLAKKWGWTLSKHTTNHIPDHFFNIGVTITSEDITFFLYKWNLSHNLPFKSLDTKIKETEVWIDWIDTCYKEVMSRPVKTDWDHSYMKQMKEKKSYLEEELIVLRSKKTW